MSTLNANQVGYARAAITDGENNRHKPINLQGNKNAKLVNKLGICLICGKSSWGLTKIHAEKHGYTPQEMADKGLYKEIR